MENELPSSSPPKGNNFLAVSLLISAAMIAGAWMYISLYKPKAAPIAREKTHAGEPQVTIAPSKGVELPIRWKDLGMQLTSAGAIDAEKIKSLYEQRGAFTEEQSRLLSGQSGSNLKITPENAGYLLNLFWALGLANKNPILMDEMTDPQYGGAQYFASTGGWTLAKGDSMNHYGQHTLVALTPEQQALVDRMSRAIYRPCCDNATHLPDCNHGMAMLGLLELMASQGTSEQDMWKAALAANTYWFPSEYATIAKYLEQSGTDWQDAAPATLLGATYSSGSGYARIVAQVMQPTGTNGGSGCGVDAGEPVQQTQGGCGV